MRVLLVEDDESIASFVKQGLMESGFAVDVAVDGPDGREFALSADYDIFILDIMLPGFDGFELVRQLRAAGKKSPVIFLTAKRSVDDRVQGLDAGADDYLVKPFAFQELLARIRALLRRPPLSSENSLQVGDLVMDTAKRLVMRGDAEIHLRPREYSVLEYLMRHPDQVLTRTQIGEHVWNFEYYHGSNVVDVYVGYLRRKIDGERDDKLIQTIYGVGYRLSER